jgi:hypothetical protein
MKKKTPSPIASANVGPMIIATMTPNVKVTRLAPVTGAFEFESVAAAAPAVFVELAPEELDRESVLVNVLANTLVKVVVCASAVIIVVYVLVNTE